jgi:hypothetical protein
VHDVDLSGDLLPRHRDTLRAIGLLSLSLPRGDWCLVGGLMVMIAARAGGRAIPRASVTKDGDVLVDVCARPGAVSLVARQLSKLGYGLLPEAYPDHRFGRCTFLTGQGQIDVLCPEDAQPEEVEAATGIRSVAIPGGRRALSCAEDVRIYYEYDAADVIVRVPLLPGAIVVKAAAMLDERTANQARHAVDVAQMLTILDDPSGAAEALLPEDLEILASCADRLTDAADVAWSESEPRMVRRGQAALQLLLRS